MLITMTCYMTKIGSLNIEGRESRRLKQVNCDTERSVPTQCDRGCRNADRIFRLKGINFFGGLVADNIQLHCCNADGINTTSKEEYSIRVLVFYLGLQPFCSINHALLLHLQQKKKKNFKPHQNGINAHLHHLNLDQLKGLVKTCRQSLHGHALVLSTLVRRQPGFKCAHSVTK